ncbi:alpha/beta fold hydrolase [Psychrobium sp. nBUS_13]|uniref:S9 family peptidase n=1 Tax=Psychrobium sp. nBUS_13 TaxID=3395319 RepID=UPI003EB93B56
MCNIKLRDLMFGLVSIFLLASCSSTPPLEPKIGSEVNHKIFSARDIVINQHFIKRYRISPNGKKLAWFDYVDGRRMLFIKKLADNSIRTINFPYFPKRYFWVDEGRFMAIPGRSDADGSVRLMVIDTLIPKFRPKFILDKSLGNLIVHRQTLSPEVGLLLKLTLPGGGIEFYSLRVKQNEVTTSKINTSSLSVSDIILDNRKVIARIKTTNRKRIIERYSTKHNQFMLISECHDSEATLSLLSVDNDNYLNYTSNCETDTVQLVRAKSDKNKIVLCDQSARCKLDLEQVIVHPKTGIPQFGLSHSNTTQLVNFSTVNYNDYSFIKNLTGKMTITSVDQNFNKLQFGESSYLGFGNYLANLETQSIQTLHPAHLAKHKTYFKRAEFVDIKLAESEHLYGYYYPPQVRLENKKPAVILIHGGPESRSYADFDSQALFLSNRGYSVFSLNYRGSVGFGKDYKRKAYENIGIMLSDINRAADWLITNKDINRESIALLGGSYGGYLALLASQSERFQCIVSINGVYDLKDITVVNSKAANNVLSRYYGSMTNIKNGKFDDFSPIKFNDYKDNSYLLIQGKYDKKIPFESAIRFYELVKDTNDVNYTLLNDGHNIKKWYNTLTTYRDIETHLSHCIGGIDAGFDYYLLAKPFYELIE